METLTDTKKVTLVDQLRHLNVGEKLIFPAYKIISLRSTISRLKSIFNNMQFSCKQDTPVEGEERTFTVTRIK